MSTSLHNEEPKQKMEKKGFKESVNKLTDFCYNQAKNAGWHDSPRETGTCLMLIVSEIAEAMEGDRKDLMDDHLPHRKMLEVELADAAIRIFDLAGREGLDLGGAIDEKLTYNRNRADHKKENRLQEGGKKY
jgi:NTP pyrophosphatase (non-canonical NTP hydrolase)